MVGALLIMFHNSNYYTMSQKNFAFLFLSELHQISMNFNKFW